MSDSPKKATFQELFAAVIRIEEGQKQINERCEVHGKLIDGHGRTLYGQDGTEGIVGETRNLTSRVKALEDCKNETKEETKNIRDKLIDAGIGLCKLAALVVFLLVVEHWPQISQYFK